MVLNNVIPCDHYLLCAREENPHFSISAFSEEHMTGIDCDVCVLFPGWFRMLFLKPCLLESSSMGVPCYNLTLSIIWLLKQRTLSLHRRLKSFDTQERNYIKIGTLLKQKAKGSVQKNRHHRHS